jgi:hypothetical protein
LSTVLAFLLLLPAVCTAGEVEQAKKRWAESPHGPMLERILPPSVDPTELPQPESPGAQLVLRYCVQCHNLPSPAMHHAAKWPAIVQRMVLRMQGRGNMGTLMADMMAGVKAPTPEEQRIVVRYLQKNAQTPLDPARYPEINAAWAEPFRLACSQCHVLPDPARHTAAQWPAVVARMEQNMQWMNRVVGSRPAAGEPQLRTREILAFLRKYARH